MIRVEAEQRSSIDFEKRPATKHDASAVEGGGGVTAGLDWQSYLAASFPGRRRHDLEAVTAYGAYRRSHDDDAQSAEGLDRVEAERGQAGSTALLNWEDEGGAAF